MRRHPLTVEEHKAISAELQKMFVCRRNIMSIMNRQTMALQDSVMSMENSIQSFRNKMDNVMFFDHPELNSEATRIYYPVFSEKVVA